MYGTRKKLCQILSEQYEDETPLNLIIWSPDDIRALAEEMDYEVNQREISLVLERINTIPDERILQSGVSATTVMKLISEVKNTERFVTVPVELLDTILITTEQALWRDEWEARDKGLNVPEKVLSSLAKVGYLRRLLKQTEF